MSAVITVTAAHIAAGERSSPWACPVALAIKEIYPGAGIAVDTGGGAWIESGGTFTWGHLPAEAREFIRAFDGGQPVRPSTFTLKIHEEEEAA